MKAFHFPLEKVLQFRKKQWEAESAILATLLEQQQHFERQLDLTTVAQSEAATRLCSRDAVDGGSIRDFAFASESGRRALRRLQLALDGVVAKVNRQRQVYVVAKRDYELVRKLRETRWATWCLEAEREQETLSTEAFLARRTQRRLALSSRMESRRLPGLAEPALDCEVPEDSPASAAVPR
ncbi:MAG: hypothetical protein KIT83_03230 [Bryobacterales bacterium]|nr:hypothetical protein [Bryobacterales bacterium]